MTTEVDSFHDWSELHSEDISSVPVIASKVEKGIKFNKSFVTLGGLARV